MTIDTGKIVSISEANQNFSRVARLADRNGEIIIFKNNKPKYLVVDIENSDYMLDLSEDERIEIVAKRILSRYLPAFKELAK